jgi:hypothetical protein
MEGILRRYFERMWLADPLREDVGVYSNQQIGWAYYFTRDPRHLRPAVQELHRLLPNAAPLAAPQDLNTRIYNPYAPIQSFAAVPRLIWALQEAERQGVETPPPAPLPPQRTAIAMFKREGKPLKMTLWGWDREVRLLAPDGEKFTAAAVKTTDAASDIQPFDRVLPKFEVYLHEVALPADAPGGYYLLAPHLELAVLSADGADAVLCSAARPIALEAGETCRLRVAKGSEPLALLGAAASLTVVDESGAEVERKTGPSQTTWSVAGDAREIRLTVQNAGPRQAWFRLMSPDAATAWASFSGEVPKSLPSRDRTLAALAPDVEFDPESVFVPGRFGQALLIAGSRKLHLPDHVERDGEQVKLFDLQQGTIEFWVKRLWDDRLQTMRPPTLLDNGLVKAWSPWKLPLNEWAHVAVVWRPLVRNPDEVIVHVYVDGLDQAFYRSTHWEGYGNRPFGLPKNAKWLEEFLSAAPPGAAFAIDELRISGTPRYADLEVEFGGQQTFNPYRFTPPEKPPEFDDKTLSLYRFDSDLAGRSNSTKEPLRGELR